MNRFPACILISLLVILASCGESDTTGPQRIVVPPTILSFSPSHGAPGTEVRIAGRGFGNDARDVVVELGDARAAIARISDDMILITVPGGAATGPIAVTRLGARAESMSSFTVARADGGGSASTIDALPPAITSIVPRSGPT